MGEGVGVVVAIEEEVTMTSAELDEDGAVELDIASGVADEDEAEEEGLALGCGVPETASETELLEIAGALPPSLPSHTFK